MQDYFFEMFSFTELWLVNASEEKNRMTTSKFSETLINYKKDIWKIQRA